MRSVGSAGRLARMSTAHRRVLTLEFDCAGMPLVGIVRDERGTGWPFSGWLGLASTLELAMGLRSSQVDAESETRPAVRATKSPESEEHSVAERLAELGHIHLEGVGRARWGTLPPQLVNQTLARARGPAEQLNTQMKTLQDAQRSGRLPAQRGKANASCEHRDIKGEMDVGTDV
jgi:hypothetical protein